MNSTQMTPGSNNTFYPQRSHNLNHDGPVTTNRFNNHTSSIPLSTVCPAGFQSQGSAEKNLFKPTSKYW